MQDDQALDNLPSYQRGFEDGQRASENYRKGYDDGIKFEQGRSTPIFANNEVMLREITQLKAELENKTRIVAALKAQNSRQSELLIAQVSDQKLIGIAFNIIGSVLELFTPTDDTYEDDL